MTFVRPIRAEDWPQYQALHEEAARLHPEAFATTYEDELGVTLEQWSELPAAKAQDRVRRCAESRDEVILVADNDCQLVGMVGLTRRQAPGNARPSGEQFAQTARVWGMYVQADFRGQQLGHALIHEVIRWAKHMQGVTKLQLEVNAINTPAIRLYRSHAFKETGRLNRESAATSLTGGQPRDIILMELLL
ncbi:MAG: GNAT family N-acetyltransferase [Chloroflexi bacterium]|nr:GNAT family N-acetyltransferase [Chloroflexota bacterium]